MKLLKYLKPYTKEIIIVMVTLFLNILGVMSIPRLTSNIIDVGIFNGDIHYILNQGLYMLIISIVAVIGSVLSIKYSTDVAVKVSGDLRKDMFSQFEKMSTEQLDTIGIPSLITRSTDDISQIQNLIRIILRLIIRGPLMMVGAVFMAVNTSIELTKLFIYFLPVLIGVLLIFSKALLPIILKTRKLLDEVNKEFRQRLRGIEIIRAFDKEVYEEYTFDKINEDYAGVYKDAGILGAYMRASIPLIMDIMIIIILYRGLLLIVDGALGPGGLIAFLSYSNNIFFSFMMIGRVFMQIPRAQASMVRISEVLDMDALEDVNSGEDLKDIESIEFKDLCFRYPGTRSNILKDLNFKLSKGDTLAIIGSTGSGKSTLAKVLMGFYYPTEGEILINGKDYREYSLKSIRNQIGYIEQNAELISGTVESNIVMGKSEDIPAVKNAIEVAQGDFVTSLDDEVAQRGQNFSGGQQQRLSIARSIYKEPSVFLIDDSFSALDYKTERNLRTQLLHTGKDKLNIIITQRVASVAEDADEILVLDNGQVAGLGTFEELEKDNEVFRSILESQDYYHRERYLSEEGLNV